MEDIENQENERLEKAKLEEERLNRAFSKKKSSNIPKPKVVVQQATTSPPKKENIKVEKKPTKNVNSNVIIDDIIEEQISYQTIEQDNKKITKKLVKKISKKKTSTIDESINFEEVDWIEGDLCAAFSKVDLKFHHAKIKKPTEYGSYWVTFLHDNKEQDTIRTSLRPFQGNEYKKIDKNAEKNNSTGVESEQSEGLAFLRSNKSKEEVDVEQEDKELQRLGFKSPKNDVQSIPTQENQPKNPSSLQRSDSVVTQHQYDVLDPEEIKENRERYEQLEMERLNRKVVCYDQEEESRRLKKEEEERLLKEKQEQQLRKVEERLRQYEESKKNQNN